jgi:hypothetical protein
MRHVHRPLSGPTQLAAPADETGRGVFLATSCEPVVTRFRKIAGMRNGTCRSSGKKSVSTLAMFRCSQPTR